MDEPQLTFPANLAGPSATTWTILVDSGNFLHVLSTIPPTQLHASYFVRWLLLVSRSKAIMNLLLSMPLPWKTYVSKCHGPNSLLKRRVEWL